MGVSGPLITVTGEDDRVLVYLAVFGQHAATLLVSAKVMVLCSCCSRLYIE